MRIGNEKSASRQRLSVTAGAFLDTNPHVTLTSESSCGKLEVPLGLAVNCGLMHKGRWFSQRAKDKRLQNFCHFRNQKQNFL
jgi:hypothetical protein